MTMHSRGKRGKPGDVPHYLQPTGMDLEQRKVTKTSRTVFSHVVVDDDYYARNEAIILCKPTSMYMYVKLPSAPISKGMVYYIKKAITNALAVYITPNTVSESIDNQDYFTITAPYTCISVYCDGSNWWII